MTVSHPQHLINQLSSYPDTALLALKQIKNSIIGNKTRKNQYIECGILPRLVGFLESMDTPTPVKAQVTIVIGSLAYGGYDHVASIINAGAVLPLIDCLSCHDDFILLEASARALKAIFSFGGPRAELFHEPYLQDLANLLSIWFTAKLAGEKERTSALHIAELACGIVARTCEVQMQQNMMAEAGIIESLYKLLSIPYAKVQEAAIDALAALCRDNEAIGKTIAEYGNDTDSTAPIPIVFHLMKDKSPSMRLAAATCLTNLSRCKALDELHNQEIITAVLPIIVRLFDESGPIREKAPMILAYLIANSEDMQRAAADADAVKKVAKILSPATGSSGEIDPLPARLRESAFLCIAALTLGKRDDEVRKAVVSQNLLPVIVESMSNPDPQVKAAACQCIRSLSRSVAILRTSLMDAGIATPLIKLLNDENDGVKSVACATICNVVLEFSPMRGTIIEQGIVDSLARHVKSRNPHLRLNAVWAINNLVFKADIDLKRAVMEALSWDYLAKLIDDPDTAIQEQALSVVQNLACDRHDDIDFVFQGFGENRLMSIVGKKLQLLTDTSKRRQAYNDEIVCKTIYIVNNVAPGNDVHRYAILNRPDMLKTILAYMSHERNEIRVGAVWISINLTYNDSPSYQDRVRLLRQAGYEQRLKEMKEDPILNVRERVKTALDQFGH